MKSYAFNPNNKVADELPFIYGYNGGNQCALVMTEDGRDLGGNAGVKDEDCMCCVLGFTGEDYERNVIGVSDEEITARKEWFKSHYPDGYRTEFITAENVADHQGLQEAFRLKAAASND